MRRYRRRWRVERLLAWLHHFRRLVVRWEYQVENFFGMVRLGYIQILLSKLCGGLLAYSYLNATMGSTLAARQAGKNAATPATSAKQAVATTKLSGSKADSS